MKYDGSMGQEAGGFKNRQEIDIWISNERHSSKPYKRPYYRGSQRPRVFHRRTPAELVGLFPPARRAHDVALSSSLWPAHVLSPKARAEDRRTWWVSIGWGVGGGAGGGEGRGKHTAASGPRKLVSPQAGRKSQGFASFSYAALWGPKGTRPGL